MLWIVLVSLMVAVGADQGSKHFACKGSGSRLVHNADTILVRLPRSLSCCIWLALLIAGSWVLLANPNSVVAVGLGLVLGGAWSNLIDVLRHGTVLDIIRMPGVSVFNLADASLVVGTLLITWRVFA